MVAATIPQLLVVGLGNLPLPITRHSVGHLVVDSLAAYYGIQLVSDRAVGGLLGSREVLVGERPVALSLFKSKSLMNISGPSAVAALRKTVQVPGKMIVIHDSLSHPVEVLKFKAGGSANGHNGLKSIIKALGGDMGFMRFQIGIGRDQSDAADYVLRKLSPHERMYWGENGPGVDLVIRELDKASVK